MGSAREELEDKLIGAGKERRCIRDGEGHCLKVKVIPHLFSPPRTPLVTISHYCHLIFIFSCRCP